MKTMVLGATGATGRRLVEQLLERGQTVKAVVRSPDKLPEAIREHTNLSLSHASILDLTDNELTELLEDCQAVASCLGHSLTFKGIFGQPRRLVTEATQRCCEAIRARTSVGSTKFLLMNTTGNHNRDLDEPIGVAQRTVIALLRLCVPPHADNEDAAHYLRGEVGQDDLAIEWVAIRPDGLTNAEEVSHYELHPSPTRSAIFNPGKTSRINVAHFMAELIVDTHLWSKWKGQMPVIYNQE